MAVTTGFHKSEVKDKHGHKRNQVHIEHNIRDEKTCKSQEHIIPNGDFAIWKHEDVHEAYERLFGDSVRKHNEKQKQKGHSERQIENYYEKVDNSKDQLPVYEAIIGVYRDEEVSTETRKEILKEFVDTWEERNPNLKLIGAYWHNDEIGSPPHVHLDFIPVAEGYKTGMETRNGLSKALEQMGFESGDKRKECGLKAWKARELEVLDELCRERGLEVAHPQMEGREEKRKRLEQNDYRIWKGEQEAQKVEQVVASQKEKARDLAGAMRKVEEEHRKLMVENMELSDANERMGAQVTKKKKEVASLNNQKEAIEKNIGGYRDKMMNVAMEKATEQVDKKTFIDGFNAGVDNMYKTVINPFLEAYNLAQEFADYFDMDGYDPADGR